MGKAFCTICATVWTNSVGLWDSQNACSRKNLNRRSCGYNVLKKTLEFLVCHFTLRNSWENKLSPLGFLKKCVTPLENVNVKDQDPWKLHIILSWTLLEGYAALYVSVLHICNKILRRAWYVYGQTGKKMWKIFFENGIWKVSISSLKRIKESFSRAFMQPRRLSIHIWENNGGYIYIIYSFITPNYMSFKQA